MKKARNFCKLFMWAAIGSFVGDTIRAYCFYKEYPFILEAASEPWYMKQLVPFVITSVVVVILIIIRVILRRIDKE